VSQLVLFQFLANRKPVWALITKDLQSRLFTKAADGTLYKIECHAECIWVGYNPHQIVTNVKDERLGMTHCIGTSTVQSTSDIRTPHNRKMPLSGHICVRISNILAAILFCPKRWVLFFILYSLLWVMFYLGVYRSTYIFTYLNISHISQYIQWQNS
jgi:hypothetical protein